AGRGHVHQRVAEPGDLLSVGQSRSTVVTAVPLGTVVLAGGIGVLALLGPAVSLLLVGCLTARTVRGVLAAVLRPDLIAAGALLLASGSSAGALPPACTTDRAGRLVHGDLHLRAIRCGGDRHGEQHQAGDCDPGADPGCGQPAGGGERCPDPPEGLLEAVTAYRVLDPPERGGSQRDAQHQGRPALDPGTERARGDGGG